MAERTIFDCDNTMGIPGRPIDDGQTLLYLLGRPDISLLGVTTTFGNGLIEQVYRATTQMLFDYRRADLPLYLGAGRRGQPPTPAARFLAETAAAFPGEITILATGPLGNLYAALQLDPEFFRHLKQIVCMGGYLHPLQAPGWDRVPEVNLSGDPEATLAVFNAPCRVTLMNAHVCLAAPFGLPELAPIEAHDPVTYTIQRDYLLTCQKTLSEPKDYLWDLLPAVYITDPDLFAQNPVWIHSTVQDLETGILVLGEAGQGAPINMPDQILDIARFYQILYEAWDRAPIHSKAPAWREE